MVIAGDACFLQSDQLLLCHEAKGRTQFNIALFAHFLISMYGLLEFLTGQDLSRRNDRESIHPFFLIHPAGFHDLLLREEIIDLTVRMIVRALGAVLAVFRASSAPSVDNGAQIHLIPCKMFPQAVCSKAQVLQITFHKKMKIIRSAKPSPVDDLLRQSKYIGFLQIFIAHNSDSFLSYPLCF